jgi:hypothetical protein
MDFKEGDRFVAALKNDEFPQMLEIRQLTADRIKYEPIGHADYYDASYITPENLRMAVSEGKIKKLPKSN